MMRKCYLVSFCILFSLFFSCKKENEKKVISFISYKINNEQIVLNRYSGEKYTEGNYVYGDISNQGDILPVITTITGGKASVNQCCIYLPRQETGIWNFTDKASFVNIRYYTQFALNVFIKNTRYLYMPDQLYANPGGKMSLTITEFDKSIGGKIKGTFSGTLVQLNEDFSVPANPQTAEVTDGEFEVQIENIK
jgi:hypothetical protein